MGATTEKEERTQRQFASKLGNHPCCSLYATTMTAAGPLSRNRATARPSSNIRHPENPQS